jgi:hypothetical protein
VNDIGNKRREETGVMVVDGMKRRRGMKVDEVMIYIAKTEEGKQKK